MSKLVKESLILIASLIGPGLSYMGVAIGAFTFVAYLFFYPPVFLFLIFIGECKTGDCYGILAASAVLNYLYYKFILVPLLSKLVKRFKRS